MLIKSIFISTQYLCLCFLFHRYVARKQLESLRQVGFELNFSEELEFVLIDAQLKPLYKQKQGYLHSCSNETKKYIHCLERNLANAGMPLSGWHLEYSQGQMEITLTPEVGILGADVLALARHAVKETAIQNDLQATFMTQAFQTYEACNGAHFNHSLFDTLGNNVFSDPDRPTKLSETAEHWIAGLIAHAPALTALLCPTVNCYRRLFSLGTPSHSNWAIEDRNMMIRAKNHSKSSTYLENRLPSGTANPYLLVAGHVAAGLDGLKRKLPLPAENDTTATKLPTTLQEALGCLKADQVIVDALGEKFIKFYTTAKEAELASLTHDLSDTSEVVLQKEREWYLDL